LGGVLGIVVYAYVFRITRSPLGNLNVGDRSISNYIAGNQHEFRYEDNIFLYNSLTGVFMRLEARNATGTSDNSRRRTSTAAWRVRLGIYQRLEPLNVHTLKREVGFSDVVVEQLPMTFECESVDDYIEIFSDFAFKSRMARLTDLKRAHLRAAVADLARPHVCGLTSREGQVESCTMAPKTDFARVRNVGLKVPGFEEGKAWNGPCLKASKKIAACMATHKSAEPGTLAVSWGRTFAMS
jgi:hypothetical protein